MFYCKSLVYSLDTIVSIMQIEILEINFRNSISEKRVQYFFEKPIGILRSANRFNSFSKENIFPQYSEVNSIPFDMDSSYMH